MRRWLLLGALIGALLGGGCADRALGLFDEEVLDLSVGRDASVVVDLAQRDLTEEPYDGPKLHLAQACTKNAQCLSGDCVTPDESRGEFDFICSARCDKATPCLEGTCLTYDHDRYWCLPSCERAQQNDDCPPGFLCCESGEDVRTCVAPVAQTCEPL